MNLQRRASPRVAASIPANYEQSGKAKGSGRIVELAAGGCILRGPELPAGSDVSLALRFDPERPDARVHGSVVHVKEGAGTALEFVYVSAEARELIMQYVDHQLAESG